METNQKLWKTMKLPWKNMETNQKPKGGSNWPPLIQKRDVTDAGPQLTSLIQKRNVTDAGPQLTSFDPKTWRHWRRAPTDVLWSKNVTSLTRGPNWPPVIQKRDVTDGGPQLTSLIQKRDVTDGGPQLTSFDPKTWRHWLGAPTDLLDVKIPPTSSLKLYLRTKYGILKVQNKMFALVTVHFIAFLQPSHDTIIWE